MGARPEPRFPGVAEVTFAALPWIGLVAIVVLPPYLVGALAVGIRGDLGLGPAALGFAVAWFFLTSSLSATTMGQVVERLGVKTGLVLGATGATLALAGLGLSPAYPWMLVAMTAGGVGNAFIQPSVNAALLRTISTARLGFSFGLKQAAVPVATLVAGLAIPTLAAVLGWRGTFGVAACVAALSAVLAGRTKARELAVRRTRRRISDLAEVRSLVLLSIGGLLAGMGATSLGVFMVDSAVASGISEVRAGLIVATVSAAGVVGRVGLGWYADVRPGRSRYGTIALLLAVAVPGYLLLTVPTTTTYVIGGLLGYIAGWSWPGLFHYAVVSQNPVSPAAATGIVQTGLSFGAGLGPMVIGFVAEHFGYDTAWVLASILTGCGAIVIFAGRQHLKRTRRLASEASAHEIEHLRWEEAEPEPAAPGVEVQHRETPNLQVAVYRLEPGARFAPPPASRTGVLVLLDGDEVHVSIRGLVIVITPEDRTQLPANRDWEIHNRRDVDVTVAHLEHRGNASVAS